MKRWRFPREAWIAVAAGCGVALASALLFQLSPGGQRAPVLPEVRLLGEPIALDAHAATQALSRLRRRVNGLFSIRLPDGQVQKVSYGDLGVEIDRARLAQLLRDTIDVTSPLSRWRRRSHVSATEPVELPLPIRVDAARLSPLLMMIKNEYDRVPVDARLNLAERKVNPSVEGMLLDVDRSIFAIETALLAGQEETELVFEAVAPVRRTEQLQGVRFDQVLSAFETPYDRSAKAVARTFNLRLAASRLDGYVLLPGEVFDFNRVVGPRDEANGYRIAPVIAEGELVDGIGGGTCQISGTLHGAVFFAGLEIVERYPHTRPSSYIKLGLDATVVYPTINFRFRNPFDFPVVLHQTVKNGNVRAEVLGPETAQAVTLIRRIDSALPYEEVERADPRVPRGQRVLAQRGIPGFKVRMYRIVRQGAFAERERWLTQYPPTTQIVRVGTGESPVSKLPTHDAAPEYTADELLIYTQQTDADNPDPDVGERREAGRFGRPGWTKEAGMPFFDPSG